MSASNGTAPSSSMTRPSRASSWLADARRLRASSARVTAVSGSADGALIAVWALSGKESFFAGHFPGRPTLPEGRMERVARARDVRAQRLPGHGVEHGQDDDERHPSHEHALAR